jgi:protein SCO1
MVAIMIDARFSLIDHDGRAVTNETYRGQHVIVFFGFTHCRVVCPRALSRITRALDLLGPAADGIVPLYISVDPERDTPAVMKTFLEKYPRFTGLTGPRDEIDATKKAFRVFAQKKVDATEPDGYVIPHTALTYLLDPKGDYVAHFADTIDEVELAAQLRKVVTSGAVASA